MRTIYLALSILMVTFTESTWAMSQKPASFVNPRVVSPCTTTTADSPALRGFRLGMSKEQVESQLKLSGAGRFPLSYQGANREIGTGQFLYSRPTFATIQENSLLYGLSKIDFGFLDNRASWIKVSYNSLPSDPGLDHLTKLANASLGINAEWHDHPIARFLICDGFSVVLGGGKMPFMQLRDSRAEGEIEQRKKVKLDAAIKVEAGKVTKFKF